MQDRLVLISEFFAITFLFISISIYYLIKHKPSINSPVSFVFLLYLMYFLVSPVFDIVSKTTSMAGISLLPYYPFTQIVFLLGFIAFLIAYNYKITNVIPIAPKITSRSLIINAILWETVGLAGYFVWTRQLGIPFFVINPFNLSNFYLTLGESSKKAPGYLALSLLFLIPSSLMFLELKLRKIMCNFPFLVFLVNSLIFFTRGVRYMILIFGGSMIMYYLKRTGKKLKTYQILAILFISIVIFSIIAYLRGSPSLSSISINTDFMFSLLTSSFSLFKPMAALVRYIPKYHPFLLGESFYYVFLMPIPRIIWPQKPYPEFLEILWKITGGRFFGYAVPNIGEYYANFGIPGVIVFMSLLGVIFRIVFNTYKRYKSNEFVLMSYAIFFFYIFQIISRGYFPQVFVQGIYLFIPLISLYLLNQRLSRK